jgi:hypothetical protein
MDSENRYALALGQAVIGAWGELPQDIQQKLFEHAVVAGTIPSATNRCANSWPLSCTNGIRARNTPSPAALASCPAS